MWHLSRLIPTTSARAGGTGSADGCAAGRVDRLLYMHHSEVMGDVEGVTGEVTRDCLVTRTRQISRVLTSIYDQELRPFGVNSPQFSLLVVISRLGPVSRAEIGRQNHQERSTLTRNLQLILAEGWAEEVESSTGGRRRPIALTDAGRELLRTAAPAWRAAQTRAKAFLGEAGTGAVLDIADVLARSAGNPARQPTGHATAFQPADHVTALLPTGHATAEPAGAPLTRPAGSATSA